VAPIELIGEITNSTDLFTNTGPFTPAPVAILLVGSMGYTAIK